MLTFIQISEHSWSIGPSCLHGTFMHTREKDVFFLNASRISLSPTPREGPFHVMFVRTLTDSENQDATKITSALADSRIYFSWTMVSFLVRTLCLCLVLMTIFLSVSPFSPSFVTMSSSKSVGVGRVNKWYQKPIREDDETKSSAIQKWTDCCRMA